MTQTAIAAETCDFEFDPGSTALLIIDMQRGFVEPGGFGEVLGSDVTPLQAQRGILDWVSDSKRALVALASS